MCRWQRLCRLCEFPAADGGVPFDALDAEKLASWWRCTLGAKFEIETDAEKARTLICQFCICEARLVHDNLQDDCSCGKKTGCDWWTGHGDDHFYQHYFYKQPLIQQCKVVLQKISSETGQELIATTSVINASQIVLQDKLKLQPRGCPEQVEIDSNLKSAKKIFHCTFCSKIFNYRNIMSDHIKMKHKNAVKCRSRCCATYFSTDGERRQHEERIHLSEGPGKHLKCMFCGVLLIGFSDMNKHIKKKHKEAIKCDFDNRSRCPKYFKTEAEKNKHIHEVHNKVDFDPSQCIYCGKTFKYKDYLSMHIRNMHADIRIKCRFIGCSVYFFDRKESEDHFLKKHQHAQSLKKFKCPKCSFRTSSKHCWRNHMLRLHTKEATLKCPLCPRLFSAKKNLDQHLRAFHVERCTCEHCGMTMQKLSMQFHFLRKHAVCR